MQCVRRLHRPLLRAVAATLVVVLASACGGGAPPGEEPGPLPGELRGVVLDSLTGLPVENVLVVLEDGRKETSGEEGEFRFPGLVRGGGEVTLVDPRCRVWTSLLPWEGLAQRPVVLRIPWSLVHDQELARGHRGKRVTAAEIQEMNVSSVMEVVRTAAPRMVGGPGGQPGEVSTFVRRGAPSLYGATHPLVILDGAQLGQEAASTLQDLAPETVAFLEIIPASAAGWRYGTNASAGVIRIVTRRGVQPEGTTMDPAGCPVDLPGGGG